VLGNMRSGCQQRKAHDDDHNFIDAGSDVREVRRFGTIYGEIARSWE
jgi:hypothetical protein